MSVEILDAKTLAPFKAIDVDSRYDDDPSNDILIDNELFNAGQDEDDHDIAEVPVNVYDLSLVKSIARDTIFSTENISFEFKVINEGTLPAYNIQIVDYLQDEFILMDEEWQSENELTYFFIDSLLAKEEFIFELEVGIKTDISTNIYFNAAEIVQIHDSLGNDVLDIDSRQDSDPNNDLDGEDDFSRIDFVIVNCDLGFEEILVNSPDCPGGNSGSIELTIRGGTPPYQILWSNDAESEDILNISAGIYRVLVEDALGCSIEQEIEVKDPDGLTCSIEIRSDYFGFGVSSSDSDDGVLFLNIEKGEAPYQILWSTGAADTLLTELTAGVYSATVTDAAGCVCISEVELTAPEPLFCTISAEQEISCPGEEDARLKVEIEGGISPYQILWSTGDTIDSIERLGVGQYTAMITDRIGNSCNSEFEVRPAVPIVASASSSVENCIDRDGSIRVDVSGGKSPYTFEWNSGDTTQNLEGISHGIYMLTITDANGCTFIIEEEVGHIECAGVGDFVWKDANKNGYSG